MKTKFFSALLVVGCALLMSTTAVADPTCDLTAPGSVCTINGAVFEQIDPQSTGTGVIDPFVQLNPGGSTTTAQGYNTDFRPNEFDEQNPANFNHSVLLADVPIVTINGVQYYQFMLDINENNNAAQDQYLSLDELQIFLGNAGNLTGFPGGLGTLVYDMDALGDSWVGLDYALNAGSGSGDMFANIPVSVFQGLDPSLIYVYLYSQFGLQGLDEACQSSEEGFCNWGASDGFEEWAHQEAEPTTEIPEPGSLFLLGSGLVGLAGTLRKRLMS